MAHLPSIISALAVALIASPCTFTAQSELAATPHFLIEKAITLRKSDKTLPRYTYLMLNRTQTRNKVQFSFDLSTLYEYTWIGDLPYARVAEIQGKALQGKALAREQARYDQAVAGHAGLDLDARGISFKNSFLLISPLDLEPFLTPAYTLSELRQETLAGNLAHVIDCTPAFPTDSAYPVATHHATLWITDSGAILREAYDVVANEPDRPRGSRGQEDFQLIDGNLLPQHAALHIPGSITLDSEQTFTRYRRFNVSSRIVAATGSSADAK
jgi:hypothetical protein